MTVKLNQESFSMSVEKDYFIFYPYQKKKNKSIRIRRKDLFISAYDIDKIAKGFFELVLDSQHDDDIPPDLLDLSTPEGYIERRFARFLLFELGQKRLYTKLQKVFDLLKLALEIVEKEE